MERSFQADLIDSKWFSPEQRLCLAMLEKAVSDLDYPYRDRGKPIVDDALAWIRANAAPDDDGLGFVICCEAIGVHPEAMREQIVARYTPWARQGGWV